jgi:hypothetical protein
MFPFVQVEFGVEHVMPSAQLAFGLPPVPVPPVREVHDCQRREALQVQP